MLNIGLLTGAILNFIDWYYESKEHDCDVRFSKQYIVHRQSHAKNHNLCCSANSKLDFITGLFRTRPILILYSCTPHST